MGNEDKPRSEEQKQADHEYREGQHAHDESQPEQTIHDITRVGEHSPEFWAGRKGEDQPEHEEKTEDQKKAS